jgi:hypothetical protein
LSGARKLVRVVFPGPPDDEGRGGHGPGLPRADGCLAVIVEEFDQFVDDFGFVFLAGPGVTRPLLGQHFRSWVLTHLGGHSSGTPFLRQRMVSSIHLSPPSVTFFLSQFELPDCQKFSFSFACNIDIIQGCW